MCKMTNILGFSGVKQSGKTTCCKFLHGYQLRLNDVVEKFLMDEDGNLIPDISNIDEVSQHVRSDTGSYSVGGMSTKLEALGMAASAGVPALIANGRNFEQLPNLINGGGLCSRMKI